MLVPGLRCLDAARSATCPVSRQVFRTENSRHWPGQPLQGSYTAVFEPDTRADQVLDLPGGEHLGRSGGGCQPGATCTAKPTSLSFRISYLDSQRLYGVNDRLGDAQRPRWAAEGGQEAVAGAVDPAATEPGQFVADQPVALGHQVPPSAVTEAGGVLGRGDDVRAEQHRGKDPDPA